MYKRQVVRGTVEGEHVLAQAVAQPGRLGVAAEQVGVLACLLYTSDAADERWIAGTMVLWAPVVLIVVSSPVRWLESLLRSEGAQHTAVSRDAELTQLEEVTARIAAVAWVVSMTSMVLLLVHHPVSNQGAVAIAVTLLASVVLVVVAVVRRLEGRRLPLRLGRG